MAANTYVTIDEVVNDAALMMGDDSYMSGVKNYQLRTLALQGLKELSFDILEEILSVQLTVSSSGTLTLPDNYIKYTKIGVLGSDGKVHFIGKQDNLNLVSGASSDTSSGVDDDPAYFFGVGGRYGVGGGTNQHGYYRVNKEENTISFSSKLVGKKIILEYISNGISTSKVHQFAEEALRSYIYWRSLQRRRGVPFGEKQLAKRDFFNEKRLANARMKSFTKDEAVMSSRKAYKQSPKI